MDELMVAVASFFGMIAALWRWLELRQYVARSPRKARGGRELLLALPLVLLVGLGVALDVGGAREVRTGGYWFFFWRLGIVWLALSVELGRWLGISLIDDALERGNVAAVWASSGTLSGGLVSFGFANFGEGDTIWTTLGPAALGFAACAALWLSYQASGAAEAISIDRDTASGLRFAGMALGSSLIIGRSMAGDYVSAAATLGDLWSQGWPALPLVALAAVTQRLIPAHRGPILATGVLPSLAFVGFGVVDLTCWGAWTSGVAP